MKRYYGVMLKAVAVTATVMCVSLILMAAATQFDLTTQVKGILGIANGGTGSAYFGITGPTAARTYTFPDASATVLTSNAAVTVAQGGTGAASLTAYGTLMGNGTGAVTAVAPGTSGYILTSTGTSSAPTWQANASAVNIAWNETPTGTINGSNTTFTLANTPTAGTLMLFKNGQLMTAAGADFTLTTNSVAFVTAPKTGDVLLAHYRY